MVTREDVARKAGVSVSAVSRTLNERGYVAEEKKQAIIEAARELGYRTSSVLTGNRQSKQLCFLNIDIYNPFYTQLFDAMCGQARQRGYVMYLMHNFDAKIARTMVMDGMITDSESSAFEVERIVGEDFSFPVISASYGLPIINTKKIRYVDVDTFEAMEIGMEYLQKQGHKKIAYATPYAYGFNAVTIQSRNAAYEGMMLPELGSKLRDYFLDPKDAATAQTNLSNVKSEMFYGDGMRSADEFIKRKCDATAIMCFNDQYALGVIHRLIQRNYRIPEDVSVMGIDGIDDRKWTRPLLTTVSMNIELLGQTCVNNLIDTIEGKKVKYITSIRPKLLKGNSVKYIG
ncbi:MAG: LacI family DNA-binding transcriptional regulator [Lachnospiraceae bacterium]|nr:LacI family DNA-binding transcriptional regulator [Lachnospiraceae bacterium]